MEINPYKVFIISKYYQKISKQFKLTVFSIIDLLWTHSFDQSEKHLLAIHPPHSLILWDVTTGTKIWKKSYTEQLTAMDSDPFDPCRLACKKSISFY